MFTPIEGIDYIFDRYAYLGLERGADKEAIKQAIKAKRAGLHPDRLVNVDEDILKQAERKRVTVDECAKILLNDDVRPLYDERLQEFYNRDERLVSKDGHAIINMEKERFDLDTLLSEDIPDTSVLEQMAKDTIQFDENKVTQMKALYQSLPGNEQIKALYKDALSLKLTYLELLEDFAWIKLGYSKKKDKTDGNVYYADDYVNKVEAELSRVSAEVIDNAVTARNDALRIGVATPVLMLTDQRENATQSGLPAVMDEAMQAKIKAKARENLEIRADYVRNIVRQKQELLQELCGLAEVEWLSPQDAENPEYEIFLAQLDKQLTILAKFNLVASTGQSGMDATFPAGAGMEEIKDQIRPVNSVMIIRNTNISDFMMEVTAVGQTICDQWEKNHKPSAQPAPAP